MSQSERMFLEALEKYKQRTKKDLTKEPFIAEFEKCKTAGDVMKILEEPVNEFIDRQEKGKVKGGLMRLLNRMVDVLLALHLNETLGEGIGLVWGPGKAVIGAVVVLLETIRGVRESYMMLIDLLEDVSCFIVRLEVYSEHTISPGMREIIVKMLVEVMSILGLATEQVREGRFKKYMKTFLRDPAVEDAFKQLNRLTSVETRMASTESLKVLYDLVSSVGLLMQGVQIPITAIRTDLDNLNGSIANIERDVSEMKRNDMVRDCRKWLSPPDPTTNHRTALDSHHEGTAVWFTEGEMMQEWKTAGTLLCIYGKPGSGKTILCSAIVEALLCDHLLPNSIVVYYYCDFRDSAKQDVDGLLSRLLISISAASKACADILSDLYSSHSNGSDRPSNVVLQGCLEKVLRRSTNRSIYVIIDALDECPDSGIKSHRNRMLKLIRDILSLGLPNVHVCITSRPEPGIMAVLSPLSSQSIVIDENIGQTGDMADYVRSSVEHDVGYGSWGAQHKDLVVKVLSEKANGMFRWVSCQLDMLRGCPPARVESALHDLPKTLDETYDRILDGVEETKAEHLLRIFQCLTVCRRPLQIQELAEVLAVDMESDIPELKAEWRYNNPDVTVLALCSTLVVVHRDTKQVQFAHFSVQEYLLSSRIASKPLKQFHIIERDAHAIIAKACLGVLLQLPAHTAADTGAEPPLAYYSARYWVEHASVEGVFGIIRKAVERFFDPSDRFIKPWIQMHDIDSGKSRSRVQHTTEHGLYYASLCGFEHIVGHILDITSSDCDKPGGHCGTIRITSVLLACLFGPWARLWRLFGVQQGGEDASKPRKAGRRRQSQRDVSLMTALGAACSQGYLGIARLLIEHGADANAPVGEYGTALATASCYGHIEVARLLIEHGADVNAPAGKYGTALEVALRSARIEVACVLIQHGVNVNAPGCYHLMAKTIGRAQHKRNGHLKLQRRLACRLYSVTTALASASCLGHMELARLLIEHGARVNCAPLESDDYYGNALALASSEGHGQIIRLLVEHGAKVNAPAGEYGTALATASYYGHVEVARLLIEHGADVNAPPGKYGTALGTALSQGHVEVARLLIEHGADVNAPAGEYGTALATASYYGHVEVARLLIEHGADVNAPAGEYGTALATASLAKHVEVVRLLIAHGADDNSPAGEDGTALAIASSEAHIEVARLPMEHGANGERLPTSGRHLPYLPAFSLLARVSRSPVCSLSTVEAFATRGEAAKTPTCLERQAEGGGGVEVNTRSS